MTAIRRPALAVRFTRPPPRPASASGTPTPAARGPVRGLGFLLIACVAVSACSALRLAYDNADWLLMRQVNRYLDLDDAQETMLEAALADRLVEHRIHELPLLVAYLRDARRMVADGLDEREIDVLFERGRALLRRTVEETIPALTVVRASLTPEQIVYLEDEIREANEDYRDEFLHPDPEVRRERRIERTIERIEEWTGDLDDEQRALVARIRGGFPDSAEDWLAYQTRRQNELLALLRRDSSAAEVAELLIAWWVRLEGRGPELELKGETIVEGTKRLILAIDRTLGESQRRRVIEQLEDYIEQFSAAQRSS